MRYALKQLDELNTADLAAMMMPSAGARVIRRQGGGFHRDSIAKLAQYCKEIGQTRPSLDALELIAKRIETGKLVLIRIPAPLASGVVSPRGSVNHLLPAVLGNKVHELAQLALVEDIDLHIKNENSVNQSGGHSSTPAVVAASAASAAPVASRTMADAAAAAPVKETITLNYKYTDGQPIEDIPYIINHAGDVYEGNLASGSATIPDVVKGSYTVEYKAVDDAEIVALRSELKTNLQGMIREVKVQAKYQEDLIDKEGYVTQGMIYTGAFITGLYEGGASIVSALVEMVDSGADFVFDVGAACWRVLGHVATGDLAGLRSEFENIAANSSEAFDKIKNCFKTLYIIAMDPESRGMVADFPKDYFDAHSSVEKTRLVGTLAFQIILALATYGVSIAVSAIAKSKYFAKAGQAIQDITKHIKLEKLNHKRDGMTNDDILDEVERIDDELVQSASFKRLPPPKSLAEATKRLDLARENIIKNGYIAKYTDDELVEMAKSGTVAKERFQIRIIAKKDLTYNTLGAPLAAESGTGAKYWLTSFDQLEDVDTDPKLISQKLGLDYDSDNPLAMVIIDSNKAKNVVDTHTIVPTFENLGAFANKEIPKKLSPEQVKTIMTPEFQATYADNIQKALDSKMMTGEWDSEGGLDYIKSNVSDEKLQKLLIARVKMQEQLGNNQHFTGNGLTKNLLPNTSAHGVVETFNFERKLVNLDDYGDAIHINHDLSLIK